MRRLFLGIDFGTGGCKVTAVSESGEVVADASVEYPTEYPRQGWSEQNPSDWYAAMCKAVAEVGAKGADLSKVAAGSFDGSTHNAVLLDGNMSPVRKTIMWTDQRSVAECEELRKTCRDEIFSTAYQMPTPTWTLPQMMWLKNNEPEVLKKTRRVLFVKDYVRYLVTGVAVTDYIEAQGTLFFDMESMSWSERLVGLSGLDFASLPEIVKPADSRGHSRRVRHERFRGRGLRRGRDRARRLHFEARHRRQRQRHDRRAAPVQDYAHLFPRNRGHVVHGVGDQRRGAVPALVPRRLLRAGEIPRCLDGRAGVCHNGRYRREVPRRRQRRHVPPVFAGRAFPVLGSRPARELHGNFHFLHARRLHAGSPGRGRVLAERLLRGD